MLRSKNLPLIVSALAIAAFSAAAITTFMQRQWSTSAAIPAHHLPDKAAAQISDRTIPVYQIGDLHGVRLVGRALMRDRGHLQVEVYPDLDDVELIGGTLIWMPGNFRSIRALMPPNVPAELRASVQAFANGLEDNLHWLTDAPRFRELYRPELDRIIGEALQSSWEAPATRAALAQASSSIGDEISIKFFDDAMPVILEYQKAAFAKVIQAGRQNFIARLLNWQDTLTPLQNAFGQSFQDSRVQSALAAQLQAIMTIPETARFARVFGVGAARRLAADPRWPDFIGRVANDHALSAQVEAIEELVAATGKKMLLQMIAQDTNREADVLALNVLRDVLLERSSSFLLLLPDTRRDIIDRVDAENWFLLTREEVRGEVK